MLSMGVIDQVVEILRRGDPVKGSIELPNSLVLWQLSYDGASLQFQARGCIDLDEPIPFDLGELAIGRGRLG